MSFDPVPGEGAALAEVVNSPICRSIAGKVKLENTACHPILILSHHQSGGMEQPRTYLALESADVASDFLGTGWRPPLGNMCFHRDSHVGIILLGV